MVKLKNREISVEINPIGAEIVSIKKNGYEYLWQKNPNIWNGQAPNLFPIIGRLKDEEYEHEGRMYNIKIHGFVKHSMFDITENTENYVSFMLSANTETYSSYPFDFDLIITYELMNESIKKQYIIINKGYKPMYFEVGGHEGFNLTFSENKVMDDYYIEFFENDIYSYTTDKNIMLNKDLKKINLNNKKLYLNPQIFTNDALILDCSKLNSRSVTLKCDGSDRSITVNFDDFDYLGIWSRPTYSNYVCIEPWSSLPDCNYIDKKIENKIGVKSLSPNKTDILSYIIEVR
ncbi:MAG: aldose 1-epimerase family protein [Clostridia bacterium]|nr:aldose 1-epimerase family protein [Clostridia bacterium]MDD4543724.1 aldose 1-epimerase family protein [Clostridia bacterium]